MNKNINKEEEYDDDDSNKDINEEELDLDFFKNELKKVAHINSLIEETKQLMQPYQKKLKQLRLEKKELENDICPIMKRNNFKIAELPDNVGKIEYKIKQAVVPLTQSVIKERMIEFFYDGPGSNISFNSNKAEEKGAILFDYIYSKENREYIDKEELKLKL